MNKSTLTGAFIGLIIGYPLSYFCQSEILRRKLPLGKYVSEIGKVMDSPYASTAIGVWIGAVVVCALIGTLMDRKNPSA